MRSAAPRPRWERRKEARPAELLAAALALFVEKGYAGTRLDDVAARAGVSKGTLYLYFENKEELFKAVVRENIVRDIAQAQQAVAAHEGASGELLAQMLRHWWQRVGDSPVGGITKLVLAESGNFPEIARFWVEEVIEPAHRIIGSVLERGIARGEFRSVDVPTFVRVLTAPMVMLLLWRHSFDACCHQRIDPQRYVDVHIDATLHALQPVSTSKRRTTRVRR
jgi:AcrR family transcriptional regulator